MVISILGFIDLGALHTFYVAHQSCYLCQGCWRKIMKPLEHGYHSPVVSASPETSVPSRISAECFWFLPFTVPNLNHYTSLGRESDFHQMTHSAATVEMRSSLTHLCPYPLRLISHDVLCVCFARIVFYLFLSSSCYLLPKLFK